MRVFVYSVYRVYKIVSAFVSNTSLPLSNIRNMLCNRATEIEQLKLINPSLKVLIGLVRTKGQTWWITERTGNLMDVFTYASTMVKFLRSHHFDGVNIDFNYADTRVNYGKAKPDFSRLIYVGLPFVAPTNAANNCTR